MIAPLIQSNSRYGTLLRTETASGNSARSTDPRGTCTVIPRYIPALCGIMGSKVVSTVVSRKVACSSLQLCEGSR
jgi:hypothetical protein